MESNKLKNTFVKKDDFDEFEKNGFINFVDTVGLLLEYRYGEYNKKSKETEIPVVFSMSNPEGTDSKNKELPHIVYRLVALKPGNFGEDVVDTRARIKSSYKRYSELLDEDVSVLVTSQIINAQMSFSVYGDNEEVHRWASRLRKMINHDIAFFEEAGIFKIKWLSEDDESQTFNGKYYSGRRITYFFQYEEIKEKEVYQIKNLTLKLRAYLNERQLRGQEPPTLIQEVEFKKKDKI